MKSISASRWPRPEGRLAGAGGRRGVCAARRAVWSILTIMGKDSLAQFGPADTAISPPTATARRLVDASLSANTRRAYAGALGQFDAWINSRQLDDAALAAYLAEAHDAVIAGLLFMGGLRRSEVSAQRSANVEDAGAGILVTVRRSKTNQEDETSDVRYLKNGPARAVRALRAAAAPAPADRVVPLSPKMIGLRFTAAAGGLERRVTAPSRTGRFGERAHQPRRVDYRRDARRQLENLRDGGPLLHRRDR